ncbi:hypothetical protein D3C84_1053190 [compost metagenome]
MCRTFEHLVRPLVQALAGRLGGDGGGSVHFRANAQHHLVGRRLLRADPALGTIGQVVIQSGVETDKGRQPWLGEGLSWLAPMTINVG